MTLQGACGAPRIVSSSKSVSLFSACERPAWRHRGKKSTLKAAQHLGCSHHIRNRQDQIRLFSTDGCAGVGVLDVDAFRPQSLAKLTQSAGFVRQSCAEHLFLRDAHPHVLKNFLCFRWTAGKEMNGAFSV